MLEGRKTSLTYHHESAELGNWDWRECIDWILCLKDDSSDWPISKHFDTQLVENKLKEAAADKNTQVLTTVTPKQSIIENIINSK